MVTLFVYGSFKKGHNLHYHLKVDPSTKFVGEAHVNGFLYDLEKFPGLHVFKVATDSVHGEVYEVSKDCLHKLDHIEGVHFGMFKRVPVQIHMGEVSIDGETYEFTGHEQHPPDKIVMNGRWERGKVN